MFACPSKAEKHNAPSSLGTDDVVGNPPTGVPVTTGDKVPITTEACGALSATVGSATEVVMERIA